MSRQHSPEEWEQQRPLIKRLYIDEKMPLPKLMLAMEESGFYATKKLYKNWIKTWKLRKNLKLEEKEALLRKQRKRKMEENKETIFWMNGDVIPHDRLIRHEKETRKEEEEERNLLDVASSAADTPSCVCYQTPPGGSPKEPDPPEPEIFLNTRLETPNRLGQNFPCLACRRYEELVADTSKMDLQHQSQPRSILSEVHPYYDNLGDIESPRAYSQSLQRPIDASSQAATLTFMYLTKEFEYVKMTLDSTTYTSSEPILQVLKMARFFPLDIPMTPELMVYFIPRVCVITSLLEPILELLESFIDVLRSFFDLQTYILRELVVRAKSLSPQDPQEALGTLRGLFCIVNYEDLSRFRGAITSLRELWKIHAEEEISYEKTPRIFGFFEEAQTLSLLLQTMFLHYQEAMRKTSALGARATALALYASK